MPAHAAMTAWIWSCAPYCVHCSHLFNILATCLTALWAKGHLAALMCSAEDGRIPIPNGEIIIIIKASNHQFGYLIIRSLSPRVMMVLLLTHILSKYLTFLLLPIMWHEAITNTFLLNFSRSLLKKDEVKPSKVQDVWNSANNYFKVCYFPFRILVYTQQMLCIYLEFISFLLNAICYWLEP